MGKLRKLGLDRFVLDYELLNREAETPRQWANLGYWAATEDYSIAAEALALILGMTAEFNPTDKVFDVGCGAGEQLITWATAFKLERFVALERSPTHYNAAARRLAEAGLSDNFALHLGDAVDLKRWHGDNFNAVLSLDSAYHYRTRARFFGEAAAILGTGGRLTLTDICLKDDTPRLARWLLRSLAPLLSIPRANLISLTDYEAQLKAAGFDTIQINDLTEGVLGGYPAWAARHRRRYFWRSFWRVGWLKIIGAGWGLAWLHRRGWVRYVLVRGEKG